MLKVGERLKYIRGLHNYSQSECAKSLDISLSSYKRYENDQPIPHDVLQSIKKLFSISIDWLIAGEDIIMPVDSMLQEYYQAKNNYKDTPIVLDVFRRLSEYKLEMEPNTTLSEKEIKDKKKELLTTTDPNTILDFLDNYYYGVDLKAYYHNNRVPYCLIFQECDTVNEFADWLLYGKKINNHNNDTKNIKSEIVAHLDLMSENSLKILNTKLIEFKNIEKEFFNNIIKD